MIKQIKNKKYNIIYLICIIWIIIFHFISYNRFGYYVDEIGSMYDAYCISNYGVDRWLYSYPIHFLNYGDGQCSLFVYILVIFFKLFGTSKIVIRSIPLLFHIITIIYTTKIVGLYKEEYKIYGCLLATILPIFYLLFQFGLESHFMLPLSAAFLYFLCKGVQENKIKDFVISGILAGITFYTYVLSYIIIPIFVVLYFTYLIIKKNISIKQIVAFMVPVLIFGIPLLFVQLINIFEWEQVVLCGITFPRFLIYRGNELGFSSFFKNLYTTFININFFENTTHLCIPSVGNIYYISIPFVIIGFISHVRKFKENNISAATVIWTISMCVLAGLLRKDGALNNTRLNGLYLAEFVCLIEGLSVAVNVLNKGRKRAKAGIILSYSICFIVFTTLYFTEYDLNQQSDLFYESYEDLPEINDKIVYVPDNYCYFLWSKKINPYDFDIYQNGYSAYENYRIGYQNFDTNSYYLVYKYDNVSQDTLDKFGFSRTELEHYYLYSFQQK